MYKCWKLICINRVLHGVMSVGCLEHPNVCTDSPEARVVGDAGQWGMVCREIDAVLFYAAYNLFNFLAAHTFDCSVHAPAVVTLTPRTKTI